MSKQIAVLTATSALALLATPAFAQQIPVDDRYADAATAVDTVATGWQGEANAGAAYADADSVYEAGEAYVEGSLPGDDAYIGRDYAYEVAAPAHEGGNYAEYDYASYGDGYEHRPTRHPSYTSHSAAPRYAYTASQREEWLAQCRSLRRDDRGYYYEDDDDGDGGLLGGILGAVVGGVVGNRVADGERLAGTLIGAGLGGLAGAVIGSAIDGDNDDEYYGDEGHGFDYCEAYLLNYERGYGAPSQLTYAPVTMVPVSQHQAADCSHPQHRRMITRVIEEEVVMEETREHPPRRRIRRAAPAAQPGKVQPLR